MILLIPFTPHLANECLELLGCKKVDAWPKIKKNIDENIKFAVQINGKTRDIISVKKNSEKNQIDLIVQKNSKAKKYIDSRKISKTIFVKNKIINYIIKS